MNLQEIFFGFPGGEQEEATDGATAAQTRGCSALPPSAQPRVAGRRFLFKLVVRLLFRLLQLFDAVHCRAADSPGRRPAKEIRQRESDQRLRRPSCRSDGYGFAHKSAGSTVSQARHFSLVIIIIQFSR